MKHYTDRCITNEYSSQMYYGVSEAVTDLPLPLPLPQMTNLWAAFPPDVAGNVDYKNICYVITHGEEKEEQ